MPQTPNFGWDLFVTGQVKVSEPLNRIVTDVDAYLSALINTVARLGEGVLDGLSVTLTGGNIEVAAGVAVKAGYLPFVLPRPYGLQKTADSGYVVVNWNNKVLQFVQFVESDMTPLAFINGSAVTDLRKWSGKGDFNSVRFNLVDRGNVSGNVTVNWRDGSLQKIRITGNTTLTFTNMVVGQSLTLILVQGSSGATVAFPSSVKWHEGSVPTMPSEPNKTLIILFFHDGSDTYGRVMFNV